MNKIYVMLPCYNESKDITNLILEWKNNVEQKLNDAFNYELQIYGIDDGSKDNTRQIILELGNKYDNVHLIAHEKNQGLGKVLDTAFRFFNANANSEDLCLLMDGDNSHRPEYVFSMIDKMKKADVGCVIASRYCSVSNVVGLSKVRQFLSDGAKIFYTLFLRVPNVKDYTCGYRVYNVDALKVFYDVYGDNAIENSSFACMMEVLYKLHKVGVKFAEVPFELRYDMKEGKSKMNVFKTTKTSIITTIKLRFGKSVK